MSAVLRLSSCLLIAAALAGCNKSAPAATDAAADTATATSAATNESAPQPSPSTAPATPPADDEAPVALDMGKVKTWIQAQKNLAVATKANPALDPAQNASEENLTQYAARLEADATMRTAITSAGLSTLDYARIGDTLIGALMTDGALEAGQLKKVPDGIDPASVDFVKTHKAEIDALMTGAGAG